MGHREVTGYSFGRRHTPRLRLSGNQDLNRQLLQQVSIPAGRELA